MTPVASSTSKHVAAPEAPRAVHQRRKDGAGLRRSAIEWLLIVGLAVLAYYVFTSGYQRLVASTALVNAILALSLLLTSFTNRLSLAQAALAGIGAYASGYLAVSKGLDPVLAIVVGALLATVFGTLLGLLALRLRGFYFAIATIAFAEIFSVVVSGWTSVTGGLGGLNGIPSLPDFSIGGFNVVYSFDQALTGYYFTLLVVTAVVLAIVYAVTGDTRVGRKIRAVGDDEVLAQSVGVAATRWRTLAFSLGALLAGIGGGLQASLLGGAAPSSYDTFTSVMVLAMVFIGGRRSVPGAVVGAVLLTVVAEGLKMAASWQLVFYGAFFLAAAFFFPNGIVPSIGALVARVVRPRVRAREAEEASADAG